MKSFDLTSNAANLVKDLFNFDLDFSIPQRKMVELGQVLSRVISMEHVVALSNKGFSEKLIDGTIVHLHQEMQQLLASFNVNNETKVIEVYKGKSDWLSFV
jgi:hypothetical protein